MSVACTQRAAEDYPCLREQVVLLHTSDFALQRLALRGDEEAARVLLHRAIRSDYTSERVLRHLGQNFPELSGRVDLILKTRHLLNTGVLLRA